MRGDLAVRVNDGTTDRVVTRRTRDLRFTKTAPGGHHSASMRLVLPRDTFPNLGPADRVYVYDARSGRTVWEGYTENPGVTDGPEGEEYDLSAMGGMVLASDRSEKLIYIDRSLDRWVRDPNRISAPSAATELWTNPQSGEPCLRMQFTPGQPVTDGYVAAMAYREFVGSGMELGAFHFIWDAGLTSTNYNIEVHLGTDPTYNGTWAQGSNSSTQGTTMFAFVSEQGFPTGSNMIGVRLHKDSGGATNIADDVTWILVQDPKIIGRRYGIDGTLLTGSGGMISTMYVRADWVAIDMLTRLLGTTCDRAASAIDLTAYQIDQLAYHDGATAQRVLDDLSLYEPDFLWEILETTPTGKHRFNYRKWPTTPRYEISTSDGYQAPGGEVDLCNRVAVYWTDAQGRKQTTIVTATVEELGSRIRDAEAVTLPPGMGSVANATQIGQRVLAAKNKPTKAARAVVRRPIVDHLAAKTVMPWEIEPGYLVRVRETGDDLRLTEMEYVDSDAAATLTLGEPIRTLDQLLAGLVSR